MLLIAKVHVLRNLSVFRGDDDKLSNSLDLFASSDPRVDGGVEPMIHSLD